MDAFLIPLATGLSEAMVVFVVASGLTLVFGVLRVLNFAHGAFFMLGMYATYSFLTAFTGGQTSDPTLFLVIATLAAVAVGVLGFIVERVVIERFIEAEHLQMMIGSYALLMLLQGIAQLWWGPVFYSVSFPSGLDSALTIGGVVLPMWSVLTILIGIIVFLAMQVILTGTWWGKVTRATASDRLMASALGVDIDRVVVVIFVAGAVLAGIAGALASPTTAIFPGNAGRYTIQAFGVIVIGGMGSVTGAFVASIVLCLIDAFGALYLTWAPGLSFYIGMTLILLLRPQGLLGQRA